LESLLIFILGIFLTLLFLGAFSIVKNYNYRVFRQYMLLKQKIFWNMFIRFSLQSYLKLLFTTVTSLQLM